MPLPLFPKIPPYRRSADLLHNVRRVVCLEKLDGTNTRVLVPGNATRPEHLVFGSRTRLEPDYRQPLREAFSSDAGVVPRVLARVAELRKDVVLFGETVGRGIQANGFIYGHRPYFVLFAATIDGAWLSLGSRTRLWPSGEHPSLRELASALGLTLAPVLYEGEPDEEQFDALRVGPSTLARVTGRTDAPQEGIVIWSDPLLLDGAGQLLVAKHKDPRRAEALDKDGDELEELTVFAERVVRLERLRHARHHLRETDRWHERGKGVWGAQVELLQQRVVQDVAREVPEYQDQIRVLGKRVVRRALVLRVNALLPALELEEG